MSKLLMKQQGSQGRVLHVTPESAGWRYVGFDLHKLIPGQVITGGDATREVCLVLVSGKARIEADGVDYGVIGERMSPFAGKPHSVYAPAGASWKVVAETPV